MFTNYHLLFWMSSFIRNFDADERYNWLKFTLLKCSCVFHQITHDKSKAINWIICAVLPQISLLSFIPYGPRRSQTHNIVYCNQSSAKLNTISFVNCFLTLRNLTKKHERVISEWFYFCLFFFLSRSLISDWGNIKCLNKSDFLITSLMEPIDDKISNCSVDLTPTTLVRRGFIFDWELALHNSTFFASANKRASSSTTKSFLVLRVTPNIL